MTLLDYYIPVLDSVVSNRYLNFQKGKNRHWLELNIDNYSIDEQRFKWMIGTFFSGDKNKKTNKAYYSTYIEFKYPFIVLSIDAEPFIGTTPFKGMYADKFAIVHTGITFSKEFDLKLPFKIPVNLSFITNPNAKKSFVTFGAGIAF